MNLFAASAVSAWKQEDETNKDFSKDVEGRKSAPVQEDFLHPSLDDFLGLNMNMENSPGFVQRRPNNTIAKNSTDWSPKVLQVRAVKSPFNKTLQTVKKINRRLTLQMMNMKQRLPFMRTPGVHGGSLFDGVEVDGVRSSKVEKTFKFCCLFNGVQKSFLKLTDLKCFDKRRKGSNE